MYFSRFLERFAVLVIALGAASHAVVAADITGAGATFPYPIYAKWAEAYKARTGNNLNYQSIGSGGGIRQIQNKTVDFGASDMPLKPEELEKSGLMQFPTVVGGDVPVVNLPGIKPGEIKLTGPVLADIYLGKIKKWNDPVLTSLNTGVKLPDQDITVVHRSDGSGTTFIWVNYLSKVSPEWKDKVGEGTSVNWPAGVGGKGNEGVASYVQRISGATFILVYKAQDKPDRAKEVLKFFEWAYADGDKLAMDLDYVPLPDSVVKMIQASWKNQIKDPSGKSVW